jgi:hypothetical protein
MKLEDRLEILDLLSNLAYYNDSIDEEGYKSLYLEDCIKSIRFQNGDPTYNMGIEASTSMGRVKMLAEKGIMDKHYYLNPILKQVSDNEVKGKVSLLILHQHLREPTPRLDNTGNCDLVFSRTSKGWKIAEFHIHLNSPDKRKKPTQAL